MAASNDNHNRNKWRKKKLTVITVVLASAVATLISVRYTLPSWFGGAVTRTTRQSNPGGVEQAQLIPQACNLQRTRKKKERHPDPEVYQFVPGTLDLFRYNKVVCPDQTMENLREGRLISTLPEEWRDYGRKVQKPSANDGEGQERQRHNNRPLIVFKRGGSGSTWFDSLIDSHPSIDFRHEVNHNVYFGNDSTQDATKKMIRFLRGKTCKSADGFCGFSVSPVKHGKGANWTSIIETTDSALVVFIRTNVIKRLLGLKRKGAVRKLPNKCLYGSSMNPDKKDDPDCQLSAATSALDARRVVGGCDVQSWELLATALDTGLPFQVLTYEGMQQNLMTTFERLGHFAGWEPLRTYDWSHHVKTAKVSSEDLRAMISNFDEAEKELEDQSCFEAMLHSESKELFPLCYIPKYS